MNALELTVFSMRFPFPDHQCLRPHGLHLPCDSQVRREGGERRGGRVQDGGDGEGGWRGGWNECFRVDCVYHAFSIPHYQCLCPHGLYLSCDSQVRQEGGERRGMQNGGDGEGGEVWRGMD